MKSVSGLVLAAVATAAAASIPTIPSDWSALVLQGVRIIQGDGVVIPGQGAYLFGSSFRIAARKRASHTADPRPI